MRIRLNSGSKRTRLNTGRMRIRIPYLNLVSPIIPVDCEVTYDDDTCLKYTDDTFAEYA